MLLKIAYRIFLDILFCLFCYSIIDFQHSAVCIVKIKAVNILFTALFSPWIIRIATLVCIVMQLFLAVINELNKPRLNGGSTAIIDDDSGGRMSNVNYEYLRSWFHWCSDYVHTCQTLAIQLSWLPQPTVPLLLLQLFSTMYTSKSWHQHTSMQKQLNWSGCNLEYWVGWVLGMCITWGCRCRHEKGTFKGVCTIEKYWKA